VACAESWSTPGEVPGAGVTAHVVCTDRPGSMRANFCALVGLTVQPLGADTVTRTSSRATGLVSFA
jgi:hypothetical protein